MNDPTPLPPVTSYPEETSKNLRDQTAPNGESSPDKENPFLAGLVWITN
jgi:hypothetical protein